MNSHQEIKNEIETGATLFPRFKFFSYVRTTIKLIQNENKKQKKNPNI